MGGLFEQMKKGRNSTPHINFNESLLDQIQDFFTRKVEEPSRQFVIQTGTKGMTEINKFLQIEVDKDFTCPIMIDLNNQLLNVSRFVVGDIIYIDYYGMEYGFLIQAIGNFRCVCSLLDHKLVPIDLKQFADGANAIMPLDFLLKAKKLVYGKLI